MKPSDKARLELLVEFQRGTVERIERISLCWFALEKDPTDSASGEELARQLHTLKGEANIMGFPDASVLAHRAEELVLFAKKRGYRVDYSFGDTILAATDLISSIVHKKSTKEKSISDAAVLHDRFDALMENKASSDDPGIDQAPDIETETKSILEHKAPPDQLFENATTPVVTEQYMRVNADVVGNFTELTSESVIAHSRYEYAVGSLQRLNVDVQDALANIEAIEIDSSYLKKGKAQISQRETIAVSTLETLQSRLQEVTSFLEQQVYEGSVRAQELEHQARQLRLVPIDNLLNKYVRVVRDLASTLGKMATARVEKTAVSLDKNVVDRIAEPLLHLVRNGIDHGLESPEDRIKAGKSEGGQISLSAAQESGYVIVSVEDDGRGINLDAVRNKAMQQGMVTLKEAESLSEEGLMALLFKQNFSTRSITTETSGRGVGLDVVKREIELLGGNVRARTETGAWTRFELRVPVSIALSRVLIVKAHQTLYAIPNAAVSGVMAFNEDDVVMVNNKRSIRFHGEPIPLFELAAILGETETDQGSTRVVVVHLEETSVAFLVDEWRNELDAIVKPLGYLWETARLFSGACTLEEGSLALVLNPAELIRVAVGTSAKIRRAKAPVKRSIDQKRILLAEDSSITRAMLARLLNALGYEVFEAENGVEAFSLLKTQEVDMIMTDVEMPKMDGIELIKAIRKESKWAAIPITVLSTRGSDEDKLRGMEAGADSYLVKTEFSEQALRQVITSQLGRS